MTCRCSPSLVALRDQLDAAHPHRSTAGDGCCASAAHHKRSPTSDHEPDRAGYAHAYDITQDPANGVDCNLLAVSLIADPRTKYVIWNRRIYDPAVSKTWRPYHGPDPHTGHLHLSILPGATHDTRPWPIRPRQPQSTPPPQEDDLTPAQAQQLLDTIARLDARLANIEDVVARWGRKNGYDDTKPPIPERSALLQVLDKIAAKP